MADRMAFRQFAPHQRRIRFGIAADEKEGRLDAFMRKRREHLAASSCGDGPVVEGQHHFMVGKIEALRIGLEADGEAALRRERERAGDAEAYRRASRGCRSHARRGRAKR